MIPKAQDPCFPPKGTTIYLASPYSHKNKGVRVARFEEALKASRELLGRYKVYSPIVYGHVLTNGGDFHCGWEHWASLDRAMIEAMETFVLLPLPGWEFSVGLEAELQIAEILGKKSYVALRRNSALVLVEMFPWLEQWHQGEEEPTK